MKKVINTEKAPAPIGPYNQAIRHGDLLFVSGQIALDPISGKLETTDLKNETKKVMENLGAILNAAGGNFNSVLKCSIFLSDMNHFSIVNEIYGAYFGKEAPARETVEVSRLPKDVNVEISCIAALV